MIRKLLVVAALAATQAFTVAAPAEAIICIEPEHLPCLCEVSVKAGPLSIGPFLNC